MRSKRFVLDANIWVSYFISRQTGVLTSLVAEKKVSFIYCKELVDEVSRVLAYPHLLKRKVVIKDAVKLIKSIGTFQIINTPIKTYIPGDENDNYIIALALQADAGFVTSGDQHILSQKEILESRYSKLQIISKAEFEAKFSK